MKGSLIIGFVDKDSALGKLYRGKKAKSLFYNAATFYSVDEVVSYLREAGFNEFVFTQTLFRNLAEIKEIEKVEKGYGKGSFVVINKSF